MRLEENSKRLFGITRSKGKMYEFGLPENVHLKVPDGSIPQELLLLTIGALGDAAAQILKTENNNEDINQDGFDTLHIASSYFDALLESRLSPSLDGELALLASVSYYLEGRPGSSLVMARSFNDLDKNSSLVNLLHWLLEAQWLEYPIFNDGIYAEVLSQLSEKVAQHFQNGSDVDEIRKISESLRKLSYQDGSDRELILADLVCAVVSKRLQSSSWINLPELSGIPSEDWFPVIQKKGFPKELWPSQMLLGQAGLFSGLSGLVQMPTSAGKTRSVEMIIRSAFMSGRASVAIVVAPFRALCHEINQSLSSAFRDESIKVDELSDALQPDYLVKFDELFKVRVEPIPSVIVLTPEKLLYIIRQTPDLVDDLGLVIYDEGHQFDSGYRGVIYELLLTEIKQLLPNTAQTILISAVIQNAQNIADWLIEDNANVVTGINLLPTARTVAFASWIDSLGQMMFYEEDVGQERDYFAPRIIEEQELELLGKERKTKVFPIRGNSTDISLYLGLRLVPNGSTAIFCGTKASAEKLITRAVEIYKRGVMFPPPVTYSDLEEVRGLVNLYILHFGKDADSTKAAEIGIYAHHGNTHHGIRLAIEHAMQQGKIVFVACTSTLAQGVNLPIRYLIVSSVNQGQERIKVRDFQNLVGRAGRAGMHTEGLVIFADTKIYDRRLSENWRFNSAKELLDPNQSEPTLSSLLSILEPLPGLTAIAPEDLVNLLHMEKTEWLELIKATVDANPEHELDEKLLLRKITEKSNLILATESYLMAHRGDSTYLNFREEIEILVSQTLAYSLADEEQKELLINLFLYVAEYIEKTVPEPTSQLVYAKTLLGTETARNIEAWTYQNQELLLSIDSNDKYLDIVWDILVAQLGSKFASSTLPDDLPKMIAKMWMEGQSYQLLFDFVADADGTKPWGESRHKLNSDDVIKFCESTCGFEFPLGIAAISQFLSESEEAANYSMDFIMHFQKSLKYGVSDELAISCYEFGIADRMLSQEVAKVIQNDGYRGSIFTKAMTSHGDVVRKLLVDYPEYFRLVLNSI